jgi:ATP-binding cassette subfamily F protein 3
MLMLFIGKTTLLKLLMGQLDPTKGIIQRHGRLRVAYFSQHHVDALEIDSDVKRATSVDFLMSKLPGKPEEEYRSMLARFGIAGSTALQPIQTLSGGQKSRVVFALMA